MDTSKLSSTQANGLVGWGAFAALSMAFVAFIVPNYLLGIIMAIVAAIANVNSDILLYYFDQTDLLRDMLFSLFVAVGVFLIIYLYVKNKGGLKALGFTHFKASYFSWALIGYAAYFGIYIVAFSLLSSLLPNVDWNQVQDIAPESVSGMSYVYTFVALVMAPSFYEEILFRGFAFQGLAKSFGFIPAAIVVNGLFGIAHFQINVAIDTFILGVVASWMVWKSRSLWPAILLHGTKNLVAYVLRFIIGL